MEVVHIILQGMKEILEHMKDIPQERFSERKEEQIAVQVAKEIRGGVTVFPRSAFPSAQGSRPLCQTSRRNAFRVRSSSTAPGARGALQMLGMVRGRRRRRRAAVCPSRQLASPGVCVLTMTNLQVSRLCWAGGLWNLAFLHAVEGATQERSAGQREDP